MPGPSSRPDPADLLRLNGLRVTGHRIAVLEVLARQPHADAGLVHREVRARIGAASVQAVYDVLAALTAAGLVRRIEPAGMPALYERRAAEYHHHLVCRGCGAIVDIECRTGRAPCLSAPGAHGFIVDEAEVTFWGLCPSCGPHPGSQSEPVNPRRTQ